VAKRKLRLATIMMSVIFLPADCVTRVRGQDSQQQRTQNLIKISQHENSTFHTNIKVVSWVTMYKQRKYTFQSHILP
jgi:hypothetical protein